jgi:hypothetical protein
LSVFDIAGGLNAAQQLFGIFFAITYGVTLPVSNRYRPFDTYAAWENWRGPDSKRLWLSITVLNLVPLIHFGIVTRWLGGVNIALDGLSIFGVFMIALQCLSLFGYQRVFTSLLYRWPDCFYHGGLEELEDLEKKVNRSPQPHPYSHLVPGVCYILLPSTFLVWSQLLPLFVFVCVCLCLAVFVCLCLFLRVR